jgi:putative flippase GtrA
VSAREETAATPSALRLRQGIRKPANWLQLLRFGIVGASGYVVNLGTFAAMVGAGGLDHRAAATLAFLTAVTNNFVWNRSWTFRVQHGHIPHQAVRFFIVSVAGFLLNLAVLELLVSGWGSPELPAQATAVALVMPMNFLGNRLWTFRS